MNKPTFLMLVGLPGSGKSTYAQRYSHMYSIHSSDALRYELFGDENDQEHNNVVFDTLHKRIKKDLNDGKSVIYDATNTSWKRRKAFLDSIKNIDCYKDAVVIATPYEVCLEQNEDRERKVPEDVVERMYRNFDIPFYNEGWDAVVIAYMKDSYASCYGHYGNCIYETLAFSQNNPHHKLSLGEHSVEVRNYIDSALSKMSCKPVNIEELRVAAILHDCGKPFTKSFNDSKGNPTGIAHYYSHECVGSYNSLFYDMSDELIDKIYVAALIRWHMILHHFKSWEQKTIDKYTNEFINLDDDFWNNLKLLNEADNHAR